MFLNSPLPGGTPPVARASSSTSLGSGGSAPSPIASEEYLSTGSLLKGPRAVTLPASAGLPSAGGGMFKPSPPVGARDASKGMQTMPHRKITNAKSQHAVFVKTARDAVGSWSSVKAPLVSQPGMHLVEAPPVLVEAAKTTNGRSSNQSSKEKPKKKTTRRNSDLNAAMAMRPPPLHPSTSSPSMVHSADGPGTPTAQGILTSLTRSRRPSAIGAGLPNPADKDASTMKSVESMKNLLAGRVRRRSNSWVELNREHCRTYGYGAQSRNDMYAIPGLSVSHVPSTPNGKVAKAKASRDGGVLDNRNIESLKRQLQAHAKKLSRYEIADQLQESMEAEKREKEEQRKEFILWRAEIKFLNEVMGAVEHAKFLRKMAEFRRKDPAEPLLDEDGVELRNSKSLLEIINRIPDIGLHDSVWELVDKALCNEAPELANQAV